MSVCRKCRCNYAGRDCRPCTRLRVNLYNAANREKINKRRRELSFLDKKAILAFYSEQKNSCACCGEKELLFLSIDHVDGGGSKHRREVGFGPNFYRWLRTHGFPHGYQVLCFNCNLSKGFYGHCPHTQVRTEN